MSAGHVQLAPDGSGKDVDADAVVSTESGTPTVYRQNIIISDPTTYANKAAVSAIGLRVDSSTRVLVGAYRCGSGFITGAASTQNLASLENPTASGRTVYLKHIEVQGLATAASTTVKFVYHLGRTTTITSAGTVLTSQKHATADATPVGIVRTGPTGTAATGDLWTSTPGMQYTLVGTNNTVQLDWLPGGREEDDITVAAGEAILVRADTNATTWFHSVDFSWSEA